METRLPAAVVLVAAFLAGGYPVSVGAFLCAAVWLAIALAAAFRPPPSPSTATLALLALAGLTLLSGLWSFPALRLAHLPALYAGLLYASEWVGAAAIGSLAGGVTVVAAAGLVGRATGLAAPSPEPGSVRLAWPIGYANGIGLLCALGVILCVGARRWLPAAVCAAALVWTLSRSAIVACLLGLLLLAALRGRRWALGGFVALAIAAAVVAWPAYHRFESPAPDTRNVSRLATVSGHGRTELWRSALREGAHHPLQGGGAGSWRNPRTTNPHSLELQTFAELGLLGLAALGVFLVDVLRRRRPEAALAAFAAWAVVAALDWDWQLPGVTGAAVVCAGALTASGRRVRGDWGLAVSALALAIGLAALVRGVTA